MSIKTIWAEMDLEQAEMLLEQVKKLAKKCIDNGQYEDMYQYRYRLEQLEASIKEAKEMEVK